LGYLDLDKFEIAGNKIDHPRAVSEEQLRDYFDLRITTGKVCTVLSDQFLPEVLSSKIVFKIP